MKKIIYTLTSLLCLISLSFGANAEIITRCPDTDKKIALTFDDGPSKYTTDKILNILDKYKIKATFFVLGENVEQYPEKLKKIKEKGHEIANHTYSHNYVSKMGNEELKNQLNKTKEIIKKEVGIEPRFFRPPGGLYNDTKISEIEEMGYKCVTWSVDSRDWSLPDFQRMISSVEKSTKGGDILLFHDLSVRGFKTPEALDIIIPYLLGKGYQFVTCSELIEN